MSKCGESGGKMRTKQFASNHKKNKDTLKESGFNYRNHIVTTSLYCFCQNCIKYCKPMEPVQCIDPYLMDMRHTYWIYHGLVMASRTQRAISMPANNQDKQEKDEEKDTKI